MDEKQPALSWKLQDGRYGAKQSAYRIRVATKMDLLAAARPDVWDSGRVESDQSIDVRFAGAELSAEKRYYWQVQVWDKDGKPYPKSDVNWWETGLLHANRWHGKWIGFELKEDRAVREADAAWISNPDADDPKTPVDTHHSFRFGFELTKEIKSADLYVTGEDTAAAWINDRQVLTADPLPAWKQTPWQTYKKLDVSSEVRMGKNLLAIDVLLYGKAGFGENHSRTPMSATLYLMAMDGSVIVEKTGTTGWKASLAADSTWHSVDYDDSSWQNAVVYEPTLTGVGLTSLGKPWQTGPVMILRRAFGIMKPVSSARLYATALGAYQFHINGHAVGDQILSPGWMDFRQHVPYQVYDVTSEVKIGRNAMAAFLASGWYASPLMWYQQGYSYGNTPPALRAQLRIEHPDGSVEWIATDEAWKADVSPILKSEVYNGETYDARKVQPGWDTASFADNGWNPVDLIQPIAPEMVPQYFEPIRAGEVLVAKAIMNPKPGSYVFDFGQNMAGVARIQVHGPAGTDIQLRFAEELNPDGTIYTENLRTAKATDHYILSGSGVERYQLLFTFHGFRYVEISGITEKPTIDTVRAVSLYTNAPVTAELVTGNAMINRLWSNILWGQKSNFIGVPSDCPQRDERLGWSADAQVFWRAASFNMNLKAFSRKYAADLRGTQNSSGMYGIFAPGTVAATSGFSAVGWSDAGVIVPWTSWIQTGDKKIIEENWVAMEKYLKGIYDENPDYLWKKEYGIPFGDWLAPKGITPQELLATAYWAYDATLMRQMAHALGNSDAERRYAELFGQIKEAFNRAYVQADGFVGAVPPATMFSPAPQDKTPIDTQTSYVLALKMNLLPDALRPLAAGRLVDKIRENGWLLGTGFLGTPSLLDVLADTGHSDVAYRLLLNTQSPSWGYMVEHGATTMWERWNGDQVRNDPSMNSYNHYAYGAVAAWLYRYAAGIDADVEDPGFHLIDVHPNFDARLGSMDFSYQSPYGKIQSTWLVSGNTVIWKLVTPPNAQARLFLKPGQERTVLLDGTAIGESSKARKAGSEDSNSVFLLPAGTYTFHVTLPQ
jgi:alpha-L-rhamnosidase